MLDRRFAATIATDLRNSRRILLVEPDPQTRAPIRQMMAEQGHVISEASTLQEAVSQATEHQIDLVITDPRPPGANGLQMREALQNVVQPTVPFIFLSTADTDQELLQNLAASEYLFLKPPDLPELNRTVGALLQTMRREQGTFDDIVAFDRLLDVIQKQEDSGVLTAYRGTTIKKVVFEEGVVSYCGSNDPQDYIGQALIKAGLIQESDLKEAFDAKAENTAPLGQILTALGKVTSEQIEQVVRRKFTETVLGLYLWGDGQWVYISGGVTKSDAPHPMRLDLEPLRKEGRRRAERWKELELIFPHENVVLAVHPERFPPGFPKNAGDKRLVQLAGSGRTLGQIRMELRGQEFAIYSRYAEFLKHGVVSIREGGKAPPPAQRRARKPVTGLIKLAESAMEKGDLSAAKTAFSDVLSDEPENKLARQGLEHVNEQLEQRAVDSGLGGDTEVRLLIPVQQLALQTIDPSEAFILSRLAGGTVRVKELFAISPLSQSEVLDVLQKLISKRIVGRL